MKKLKVLIPTNLSDYNNLTGERCNVIPASEKDSEILNKDTSKLKEMPLFANVIMQHDSIYIPFLEKNSLIQVEIKKDKIEPILDIHWAEKAFPEYEVLDFLKNNGY